MNAGSGICEILEMDVEHRTPAVDVRTRNRFAAPREPIDVAPGITLLGSRRVNFFALGDGVLRQPPLASPAPFDHGDTLDVPGRLDQHNFPATTREVVFRTDEPRTRCSAGTRSWRSIRCSPRWVPLRSRKTIDTAVISTP